jgi:hypothetical protein
MSDETPRLIMASLTRVVVGFQFELSEQLNTDYQQNTIDHINSGELFGLNYSNIRLVLIHSPWGHSTSQYEYCDLQNTQRPEDCVTSPIPPVGRRQYDPPACRSWSSSTRGGHSTSYRRYPPALAKLEAGLLEYSAHLLRFQSPPFAMMLSSSHGRHSTSYHRCS